MKLLLSILISLLTVTTFAQRDSVAFFYSDEKVVVVVNELNPYGRLSSFIDNVSETQNFRYSNTNESCKISCSRGERGVGCRFIFKPDSNVIINDRRLSAEVTLNNILRSDAVGFEMSFNSSMNDKFTLKIMADNKISMSGSKILRTTH